MGAKIIISTELTSLLE